MCCFEPLFFFCRCAAYQQILQVILQHDNDVKTAQYHSLSNDVLVCVAGQIHANENVGNTQSQGGSAQCPVGEIPYTPQSRCVWRFYQNPCSNLHAFTSFVGKMVSHAQLMNVYVHEQVCRSTTCKCTADDATLSAAYISHVKPKLHQQSSS